MPDMSTRDGATRVGRSAPTAPSPSPWARGDYHRFAKATIWEIGPVLVDACGISAGQRVLDVAAGTGNAAIRAAERGARVVASDITPENFNAGRAEAAKRGVEIDWVAADAQALPFDDGTFDVVTSVFGAIFAPDHRAVADELLRVCRPGGVIGLTAFTPEGLGGTFFGLFEPYLPPPPAGAEPAVLWGTEAHVEQLLGGRTRLEVTRAEYTEKAPSPEAYRDLFVETFGPVIAVRAGLADEPERRAAFDRALLDFAISANTGPRDGPAVYPYEYLLITARTR